ncbi:potassium-transporting ATPase subunit F [Microbispora sp. NBC_01389]
MSAVNAAGLAVVSILLIFMVVALLFPERF